MTKIFKNAGIEYELDMIIKVKGQGIILKTNSEQCYSDSGTIISAEVQIPVVVKQDKKFLILIDSTHPRNMRNFEVVLVSRHLLKKAKIEPKQISSITSNFVPQGGFKRSSPWILSSESARAEIRQ